MKNDFKKAKGKIGTIIGQGVVIEGGTIKGSDGIQIDGTVLGDLHIEGCVIIGDTGTIKGNITSSDVLVAGSVEGNISCSGQVYLSKSSHTTGDITYKYLVIDEGAHFNGRCTVEDIPMQP